MTGRTTKPNRPAALPLAHGLAELLPGLTWELDVFVPGRAAPQGSKHARPIYRGRGEARVFTGKVATVESSKAGVAEWRADVRQACADAWGDRPPLDCPLVLEVEFVRPRPLSAPKRSTPSAISAPDLSKLVRSTEDAITSAGVWRDDSRVIAELTWKRLAEIDEIPGARIRIGVPAGPEIDSADHPGPRPATTGDRPGDDQPAASNAPSRTNAPRRTEHQT